MDKVDWETFGIYIVIIGIFFVLFGGIAYAAIASHSADAQVITSSQYNAGTIKDGDTYTVIGYNITIEYDGLLTTTTVLCPLYPVNASIPIAYNADWWGFWPSITIATLPNGCQTNGYSV